MQEIMVVPLIAAVATLVVLVMAVVVIAVVVIAVVVIAVVVMPWVAFSIKESSTTSLLTVDLAPLAATQTVAGSCAAPVMAFLIQSQQLLAEQNNLRDSRTTSLLSLPE
jgi:hypothetical protein